MSVRSTRPSWQAPLRPRSPSADGNPFCGRKRSPRAGARADEWICSRPHTLPVDERGMDFAPDAMVAAFMVSTFGLGFFIYGKKQSRLPQLVAGIALMVLPSASPGADTTWLLGGGVLVALWIAVRGGL